MRVLVVEDNPVSAVTIASLARQLGHEVTVVADATSALATLETSPIDVVLGDWFLPDLNGPELCRRIQARTERFVPFIYVSAQGDRARQLDGMRAGAIGYLTKPVSSHDLAIQLLGAERVLALHRELEDQRRQLRQTVARLQVEVRRDHTTGLANRACFDEDMQALRVRDGTWALAMIDLDEFKAYNDALGHPAGDEALRRVADLLTTAVRGTDRLYRYGGEELVMLLSTTDADTAARVVDRLRQRVQAEQIPHPGGVDGLLTFSAGVAMLTADRPWRCALQEADRALYRAKLAGRNRVVAADPRGEAHVRAATRHELGLCQAIRRAVFVDEQGIDAGLEADGRDESAHHLLAFCGDEPAGTARFRLLGADAKAERVSVLRRHRGRGLGLALMVELERQAAACGAGRVILHAQESVIPFYEAQGYLADGPMFVEAGIRHLSMYKELPPG